jgi:hypothetical protein
VNRWSRYWRLSALERGLLWRALVLLPLTTIALRVLGFRRWHAALARLGSAEFSSAAVPARSPTEKAQLTTRLVQVASREGLCRTNCLEQSVVLWWLLRRQGISSDLRIGVCKSGDGVAAHAWVEIAGMVLNDAQDVHQHYAAFDRAIAAAEVEPR